MHEKPNLRDDRIIKSLNLEYHLKPTCIDFLALGDNAYSWAYKITCKHKKYFLKLRRGRMNEASLFVPQYLYQHGIKEVVAPIKNTKGQLSVKVDNYTLFLLPFIKAKTILESRMTNDQWARFGHILRRVHNTKLPPSILRHIHTEDFSSKWDDIVKILEEKISAQRSLDILQDKFSSFWRKKSREINTILTGMEDLRINLKNNRALDFVLCHKDIHTSNVLVDNKNEIFIVDWDGTLIAPKERDLMYITPTKHDRSFFRGYGKTFIDYNALAYYQCDWAMQGICSYGERLYLMPDAGIETKKAAVVSFLGLFQPGDLMEAAHYSLKYKEQRLSETA